METAENLRGWSKQVRSACADRGLQLTPTRAAVVDILAGSGAPLGAYTILEALSRREGKAVAPPTVYRALEFLTANGFVHRIDSRNAFAPCSHVGHAHAGVMFSCEKCGRSVELADESLDAAVAGAARAAGFVPKGRMIEVAGLCEACAAL